MPILEKDIENSVNKEVRTWGVLYLKVKFVESGYPDRLYILPNGLSVWVEFKRKGEKPEPLQFFRMKFLRERRQLAGWTDEFESTCAIIKTLLAPPRLPETSHYPSLKSSLSRIVSRPGARENLYLPSILEDFEEQELHRQDINYSPPPPGL